MTLHPGHIESTMIASVKEIVIVIGVIGVGAGCVRDLEHNSGGDGYRHEAQELSMESWVVDEVNAPGGDRTDWWQTEPSLGGTLTAIVRLDEPDLRAEVGIFDRTGVNLATAESQDIDGQIIVRARMMQPTKVFIMVRAHGGPSSAYSLKATLGGGDAENSRPGF